MPRPNTPDHLPISRRTHTHTHTHTHTLHSLLGPTSRRSGHVRTSSFQRFQRPATGVPQSQVPTPASPSGSSALARLQAWHRAGALEHWHHTPHRHREPGRRLLSSRIPVDTFLAKLTSIFGSLSFFLSLLWIVWSV